MKNPYRLFAAACLLLIAACEPDNSLATDPVLTDQVNSRAGRRIGVLSRNIYVGADLDAVIGALASPDPADDLPALQTAIGTLQRTDFATRARALAAEVARTRPDVIGLQEVSEIHVDLRQIGMPVQIDLDFFVILMDEFYRRGLDYYVAAQVLNTEASPLPFISLKDRDMLLVRGGISTDSGVVARNFQYNIGAVAPGVDIKRGYVVADLTIDGRRVTVANTHLESGSNPQIAQLRAAQAVELATVLGAAPQVVLMGDLNDTPGSVMYQVLQGAGLVDAFAALRPEWPGLTCCHLADLSNRKSALTQRIDYVWQRGLDDAPSGLVGRAFLVGNEAREKVPGPFGPIWASDHAGVFVEMKLPRP